MTTTVRELARYAEPPQRRQAAVILAATDGTEHSDAALRVAVARARATRARVEVITVLPGEPIVSGDGLTLGYEAVGAAERAAQRELIEEQLLRVTGGSRRHVITILSGNATYAIARVAVERRAALVVVGLGRHGLTDRLFSDETALQLIRMARIPVLAVPEGATALPRRIVVAIDFSAISVRAAQCALDTLADGEGEVELVHVLPPVLEHPFALEPREPQEQWAETQLDALRAQLAVPPGVTVRATTVRGKPAPALLEHAARVRAELIVTGTHGRGFVARMLLGSVATKLVRATTCPILAVPRDPLPMLDAADRATSALAERVRWAALVGELTRRNRGRRTIIESDDPGLGAQSQEYNYPFIGAVYDERNDHLKLMLGDGRSAFCQVSRNIDDVRVLDVLTDDAGRDRALRVEHGTAQTLMTFAE